MMGTRLPAVCEFFGFYSKCVKAETQCNQVSLLTVVHLVTPQIFAPFCPLQVRVRTTPSLMVSCPWEAVGEGRCRPSHHTLASLSRQTRTPSGNGGCWWQPCSSSQASSSSPVRMGLGQEGHQGWEGLGVPADRGVGS